MLDKNTMVEDDAEEGVLDNTGTQCDPTSGSPHLLSQFPVIFNLKNIPPTQSLMKQLPGEFALSKDFPIEWIFLSRGFTTRENVP